MNTDEHGLIADRISAFARSVSSRPSWSKFRRIDLNRKIGKIVLFKWGRDRPVAFRLVLGWNAISERVSFVDDRFASIRVDSRFTRFESVS
jgi:hypothetical protein